MIPSDYPIHTQRSFVSPPRPMQTQGLPSPSLLRLTFAKRPSFELRMKRVQS